MIKYSDYKDTIISDVKNYIYNYFVKNQSKFSNLDKLFYTHFFNLSNSEFEQFDIQGPIISISNEFQKNDIIHPVFRGLLFKKYINPKDYITVFNMKVSGFNFQASYYFLVCKFTKNHKISECKLIIYPREYEDIVKEINLPYNIFNLEDTAIYNMEYFGRIISYLKVNTYDIKDIIYLCHLNKIDIKSHPLETK